MANLQLSGGYSVNNLYVVPVLLAIWAPNPRSAYWVTALASLLLAVQTAVTPAPRSAIAACTAQ